MELNRFKQLLESTMGNVKPLVNESDEDISYDIQSVKCDENELDLDDVYVDEDDTIVIRYCKGDSKKLDYLKRKGKMELYSKHGLS
jgi:hypothetical protein